MKKFLMSVAMLVTCSLAQAFTVESGYIQQQGGQYVKATKVTCDAANSQHCMNLCQNASECQRAEPYCRNCAGTTSPLLRQLFTELSRLYTIKNVVADISPLIRYMTTESYVLLDVNSIFNYYTPVGGEAFVGELTSFCGESAPSALLAVKLDQVHQPAELNYVLCRDNVGQTVAFEVAPRKPVVGQRPLKTQITFKLN